MTAPLPRTAEVGVVGAGVAGLVAADELRRRGVDVVVLEAADRVGGRTLVETTALGSTVDLGGQWLGAGHHRFEDLARELGLTPFRMHSPATPAVLDGPSTLGRAAAPVLAASLALAPATDRPVEHGAAEPVDRPRTVRAGAPLARGDRRSHVLQRHRRDLGHSLPRPRPIPARACHHDENHGRRTGLAPR